MQDDTITQPVPLSESQKAELDAAAAPLIQYLRGLHPHQRVIVTSERAEMLEGVSTTRLRPYDEEHPEQPIEASLPVTPLQ